MPKPPAGWRTPYIGLDYAYTDAGYGNYADKALKTKRILMSSPAALKFCRDWQSKHFISSPHAEKHTSANVILPGDNLKNRHDYPRIWRRCC